jgi:hypothetical protein
MMVIMAWNTLGFHIVSLLSKREMFNATHYVEHILESILILCLKSGQRCLAIHADNAKPYIHGCLKYFVTQIPSESFHVLHTLRIGIIRLLSIRIYEILFEKKFLSFRRAFSEFTQFSRDFTNHFAGRVQELDGQIGLSCHTRRSALSLT